MTNFPNFDFGDFGEKNLDPILPPPPRPPLPSSPRLRPTLKPALEIKCSLLGHQKELVGPPQLVYIHARPILASHRIRLNVVWTPLNMFWTPHFKNGHPRSRLSENPLLAPLRRPCMCIERITMVLTPQHRSEPDRLA